MTLVIKFFCRFCDKLHQKQKHFLHHDIKDEEEEDDDDDDDDENEDDDEDEDDVDVDKKSCRLFQSYPRQDNSRLPALKTSR